MRNVAIDENRTPAGHIPFDRFSRSGYVTQPVGVFTSEVVMQKSRDKKEYQKQYRLTHKKEHQEYLAKNRERFRLYRKARRAKMLPEKKVRNGIIKRCYYPSDKNYYLYGGRGIGVCDRWRYSFENFLNDMGSRPSVTHHIDRIDSNGNYCPENCRWVTPTQNRRNRRDSKLSWDKAESIRWHHGFARYTVKDLAEMFGVSYSTIGHILTKRIWRNI